MKKLSIALFLIIAFCFASSLMLLSCKQKEEVNTEQPETKEINVQQKLVQLESFNDFPEEIDGPGCVFSFGKKDYLKGGKYIYSDDLDSICYIKVKDNFIRLKLVAIDTAWFPIMHYSKKFRNDDYQLSVDVKKIDEDDEVSLLKGIILFQYKDEPEQKKGVYGFCGC